MIKNNPEDDDIFIFFSLEMQAHEIIQKWQNLIGDEHNLSERLYVVSNEDQQGNSLYLNLQDIYAYIKDISKVSGRRVKAIAIDHSGLINKTIDVKRKPDFGLAGREDLGFSSSKTLTDKEKTQFIKSIAKELDIFVILQSQTTKEKAGEGDVPLGLGAAYGAAQFEWDMDRVLTIWQPIKRVQHKTNMAITAWQYCKIRSKHKDDLVKTFEPCVLSLDLNSGRLKELSNPEFEQFLVLNSEATQLRKMAEKHEGTFYSNSNVLDPNNEPKV
jgi:uncharacterized protein YfkK (UPF0435 family)